MATISSQALSDHGDPLRVWHSLGVLFTSAKKHTESKQGLGVLYSIRLKLVGI